jgi:hypothetical protein
VGDARKGGVDGGCNTKLEPPPLSHQAVTLVCSRRRAPADPRRAHHPPLRRITIVAESMKPKRECREDSWPIPLGEAARKPLAPCFEMEAVNLLCGRHVGRWRWGSGYEACMGSLPCSLPC